MHRPWKTSKLKSTKTVIVGFGDVGHRIAQQFAHKQAFIAAARQQPNPCVTQKINYVYIDLDNRSTLKRLTGLANTVIYLAPPSTQDASNTEDLRMRRFIAASAHLKHCVYVSTTGVYGLAQQMSVTETHVLNPTQSRGHKRLSAETQLRKSHISHISILRAPGIYAYDTLSQRLPIERLKSSTPTFIDADDVPCNHIHADDLARLCWLAQFKGRNRRSYNASDGQSMMHADYLKAVAHTFNLAPPVQLPYAQVQAALSPIAWGMLANGRRISNQRLIHEWAIQLKYPNVLSFLKTLTLNWQATA